MRVDQLLLGLCVPPLAAAPMPQSTGLVVETGSPDALCPELNRTREAIHRRIGALEVQGGAGWRARYTNGHAPEGQPRDFIRLELFDPEGALRLARDLPAEADSCSTMADVIALVLERYFRSLEPEQREPSAPADPATPAQAPPSERAAPPPRTPELPVTSEPARGRLAFLAGEAGATSRPLGAATGLRALAEVAGDVHLGGALLVALSPEVESGPRGGEIEARALMLRALAAWGPRLGRFQPYVGPEVLLMFERGTSSGLDRESTRYRAVWGFGLAGGLALHLSGPWLLSAFAAGQVMVPELGGRFEVEGEEVLRPPPVQGWLGLGVGYAFSP